MSTVLITGFEPFGGESINPALEAVRQLSGRTIAGHRIVIAALPVVRYKATTALISAIESAQPQLIIAVGQAGGRPDITLERVAINVDDFRIADNEGNQPIDDAIVAGGPAAYWSTLPIKSMTAALRQAGIPAQISNTAGTFVCNHLFYGLQHYLAQSGAQARGGFIHIPYLPEQAARHPSQPSMALATIITALEVMIAAALATQTDAAISGGTIC